MVDACSIRFLCELISISYSHAAFAQRWEGTTLVTNDAMASDGASSVLLLRTAYADGDSLRKLQWKIWVGDHVQVEARSFLKGVLARRDELALGRLDLEPFFQWHRDVLACPRDMFLWLPSEQAAQARGLAPSPFIRSEWTTSLHGCVLLLVWLATFRRRACERETASQILNSLCVGAMSGVSRVRPSLPHVTVEDVGKCQVDVDEHGECRHFRKALATLFMPLDGEQPIAHLVRFALQLARQARADACGCLDAILASAARGLEDVLLHSIEDDGGPWSGDLARDFLVLKGRKRTMRIDRDHVQAMEVEVARGRQRSVRDAIRANGDIGVDVASTQVAAELRATLASQWLHFADARTYCVSMDAARVSHPGEEMSQPYSLTRR